MKEPDKCVGLVGCDVQVAWDFHDCKLHAKGKSTSVIEWSRNLLIYFHSTWKSNGGHSRGDVAWDMSNGMSNGKGVEERSWGKAARERTWWEAVRERS